MNTDFRGITNDQIIDNLKDIIECGVNTYVYGNNKKLQQKIGQYILPDEYIKRALKFFQNHDTQKNIINDEKEFTNSMNEEFNNYTTSNKYSNLLAKLYDPNNCSGYDIQQINEMKENLTNEMKEYLTKKIKVLINKLNLKSKEFYMHLIYYKFFTNTVDFKEDLNKALLIAAIRQTIHNNFRKYFLTYCVTITTHKHKTRHMFMNGKMPNDINNLFQRGIRCLCMKSTALKTFIDDCYDRIYDQLTNFDDITIYKNLFTKIFNERALINKWNELYLKATRGSDNPCEQVKKVGTHVFGGLLNNSIFRFTLLLALLITIIILIVILIVRLKNRNNYRLDNISATTNTINA